MWSEVEAGREGREVGYDKGRKGVGGQWINRLHTHTHTHTHIGGYRMVYVPGDISHRFEDIASSNTRQNIETCGILAGTLVRKINNMYMMFSVYDVSV